MTAFFQPLYSLRRAVPHPSWASIPCPCPSWRADLRPWPRSRQPDRPHRPRPAQWFRRPVGRMTGTPRISAWNCISSVVEDHAAVDLEGGQRHAGVGVHRIQHFAGLVGGGFQGGAGDVALGDVAGHADDGAAGIALPVGGEQAGEGRHEVDAAVVFNGIGQRFDVGGLLESCPGCRAATAPARR